MNAQNTAENLYEIPSCTICLNQLSQDLSNLNCGHVYHLNCISQHFQYKGTCPNCQKRSHAKEIRMVVYPLVKNTQAAAMMRQILGNLSVQQKQQIQTLFKQYQGSVQKCQKLQRQYGQSQKQNKKLANQLNQAKLSFNRSKVEVQTMRRDSLQLKKVIQHLQCQIKNLKSENLNLGVQIQRLKQKQKQMDSYKQIKRKMGESSMQLIAYKNQLQGNSTPPQKMASIFFDMVMIKNLDIVKLKNNISGYPQRIAQKEDQIKKLKSQLQRQKKQLKDFNERYTALRKKYDDLKLIHRKLIQKYKTKCNQTLSEDQNYQDSMLSRPIFPIKNGSSINRQPISNNMNTTMNSSINWNNNSNMSINQQKKEEKIFLGLNQNNNINLTKQPNRLQTKNSSLAMFEAIIMQQQSSNNLSRANNNGIKTSNNKNQKQTIKRPGSQGNLNSFVTQKNSSFGSFGGVIAKKKAEDKKLSIKNLFG